MKRTMKILLFAAMLLTVAATAFCDGAYVSTNNTNAKPGVMNGVILDTANAKTEKDLTPEEQAANFKPGWDAGISEATKRIELDPENVTAYANRGHFKISKRDYDGALEDYTKIIELNKTFIDGAYYDRGLAKQAKGDFDGAIADFTKAVELNPNKYAKGYLYYSYSARGYVKLSKGDFDGAIVDFNKALEIQPDYASAYIKAAVINKGSNFHQDQLSCWSWVLLRN
jgi:tetratricopeptide (TPR) repeat protein